MTVIVSQKDYKLIFIHITKNAGCSVANSLLPLIWDKNLLNLYKKGKNIIPSIIRSSIKSNLPGRGDPITFLAREYLRKFKGIKDHMKSLEIENLLGEEIFSEYYSFAVSRNPYSREVSLYRYLQKSKKSKSYELVKSFKEFDNFVNYRCSKKIPLQKYFVVNKKDKLMINKILKLENLNEEFKVMCKSLKVPSILKIPHINSSGANVDWRSFYNNETRKKVSEAFAEDFEFFNYDKT